MSAAPPVDATASPAPNVATFPNDDSLCESCGYSLRGLTGSERCPECGTRLAESDPARRVGLPWQNKMSVGSWLRTTWMVMVAPRRAFRVMRIPPPTLPRLAFEARVTREPPLSLTDWSHRIYLLIALILATLPWGGLAMLVDRLRGLRTVVDLRVYTAVAALCMLILSMLIAAFVVIEATGVTWVARRRGWRVPFRAALRLASFSSIGFVPASLVFLAVMMSYWRIPPFVGPGPFPGGYRDLFVLIIMFGISILWFETLVWLGVRQVRYANFAYPAGANLTR